MPTTLLEADRIRNGRPVKAEIAASYQDTGHGLPFLVILSAWSPGKCQYRTKDVYRLEEIPAPDGRAFLLHRSEQAIADGGPEAEDRYGVFICRHGQNDLCECRGFARFGYCKHTTAVRGLIQEGILSDPLDRPADADPVGPAPW